MMRTRTASRMILGLMIGTILLGLATVQVALGQVFTPERDQVLEQPEPYSPYVDQHYPNRVYWGDTHHHTILSFDDGLLGTRLGPEESFRFARGEEVTSNTGLRAKLMRPLDFLVVSDHAEYLGIADQIRTADPDLLATEYGKRWYDMYQAAARGVSRPL